MSIINKIKLTHIFKSAGIAAYTVICLILTSCYQDVDLDKYRSDAGKELLTLNSILTPDSVVMAAATKTYFYSDVHTEPVYIEGLNIHLKINGNEKGAMRYDSKKKLYVSDIKPESGDKIELATEYNEIIVSAHDSIPQQITIENIDLSLGNPHHNSWGGKVCTLTYRITFSDDPLESDFYYIGYNAPQFTDSNWTPNVPQGQYDLSHNLVFQKLENLLGDVPSDWLDGNFYYGLPFSDSGINGKTHTLTIEEEISSSYLYKGREILRNITLYKISESYFQYLLSRLRYDASDNDNPSGMIDLGLADPMRTFTNVQNGIGILGCYTSDRRAVSILCP